MPRHTVASATPADPGDEPGLVSIGLPVYNGAEYLAGSVESLLGQSYRRLELVISDNASTDFTETICRAFAQADERVVYSRLNENIGGVANHTRVFELARGEYFMWASSDDLWRRDYVERCVAVLHDSPSAVAAYALNANIDESGNVVKLVPPGPALDSDDPVARFSALTDIYRTIEPFYALVRRAALIRIARMKRHPGFDRILFAELGLLGKLCQIREPLYQRRIHPGQSVGTHRSLKSRYRWIDPRRRPGLVWPHVEYLCAFAAAAWRSAPDWRTRLGCAEVLLRWCNRHRTELLGDLIGKG